MAFSIAVLVSEPVQAQSLQADIDYVARELAEQLSSLEVLWKGIDGVERGVRLIDVVVNCVSSKALTISPVDRATVLVDWPTTRMLFTSGPESYAPGSPWKAKFACDPSLPCVLNRSLDRRVNWKGSFILRENEVEFRDPGGRATEALKTTLPLFNKLCGLQQQAGGRVQ